MSRDNLQGARRSDGSAWSRASDVLAVRGSPSPVVADATQDHRRGAPSSAPDRRPAPVTAVQIVPLPDQVARDLADIEKATVALKAAVPALEAWPAERPLARAPRQPRPVWMLIGGIWIATALAVAVVVGAVAYVLR